ncbi:MAG TPA: hypothetical protein VJP06_00355 [Thermoplasmata archaeon]|nr:hypothetical protein [Thermoplasmata archaeon]
MTKLIRLLSGVLACLLVAAPILAISSPVTAAMVKPAYLAGDRWIYGLQGTLDSLPGVPVNETGPFQFGIVGRVEVDVIGSASVVSRGTTISAVRVDTRTSGFLNGTFSVPGVGSAQVTGTISTSTTEFWEDESYLVVQSTGTTAYNAQVMLLVSTPLTVNLRLNTTTTFSTIPPFGLDVGQNATVHQDTFLAFNSTFTAFGRTSSTANQTNVSATWRREVVSAENVTVDAGTFFAYKLNQTLGSFPGIPGGFAGGANETAYFSNDAGYYAKRVAYSNGTPVAEMSLKAYTYGANRPSGLNVIQTALFVAVLIVIALVLAILIWRRRKGRIQERTSATAASQESEDKRGGNQGAR